MHSYATGMVAYLFGSFLLLFAGVYTVIYNLQDQLANFEYVPGSMQFAYLVMIPILSMRVLAEERKQKTDQLLFSLPFSTLQIVCGKYLAMLTVLAVPLAVIGLYPLLLSCFGPVNLLSAYAVLAVFFLMGASLLAVGLFLSSLTESQAIAAGLSFGAFLLNYFIVSLASYVPRSAWFSFAATLTAAGIAGALLFVLRRKWGPSLALVLILVCVDSLLFIRRRRLFEGLIPLLMKKSSLFRPFYTSVNGRLDLSVIVYYLTVSGVFVFFAVESMERRRWC